MSSGKYCPHQKNNQTIKYILLLVEKETKSGLRLVWGFWVGLPNKSNLVSGVWAICKVKLSYIIGRSKD